MNINLTDVPQCIRDRATIQVASLLEAEQCEAVKDVHREIMRQLSGDQFAALMGADK